MKLADVSQCLLTAGLNHVLVAATAIPKFEDLKDMQGTLRSEEFDLFPKYRCFLWIPKRTQGFTVELKISHDGWGNTNYKVGIAGTEPCLIPSSENVPMAGFATTKKAYAATAKLLKQIIKAKDVGAIGYREALRKAEKSMNPTDLVFSHIAEEFRQAEKSQRTYDIPCLQWVDWRGKQYPVQLRTLDSMSRHYLGDDASHVAFELRLTASEYSDDVVLVVTVASDLSTTLIVVGSKTGKSFAGELSSKGKTVIKSGEWPDADKWNIGKSVSKLVHSHSKQILAARSKFNIAQDESVRFV